MRPASKHHFTEWVIPVVILICALQFISCGKWTVPKELANTWSATHVVSVRYQTGFMSFNFVKDTVRISVTIREDGRVSGTLGGARFEDCSVAQNRGWFGKTFNLFTDYIITGKLSGSIFSKDTLISKEISMPFNLDNNSLIGGIFQKQGSDAFPMVSVHLTTQ
jgi:hypothetical protein